MNPLVKAILGAFFRHVLTILLTLVVVNHYVGADIAQKLMHGDTVSLWQGYQFSVDTMVDYLVATLPIAALPILIAIWTRIKARFKFLTALQLPSSASEQEVKIITQNASAATIVKSVATGEVQP